MRECDKRKRNISSKVRMIYISSNNVRRPVTNTFTTLHCPLICLNPIKISYRSISPNITTLHSTFKR
jgi:hypothetical protein